MPRKWRIREVMYGLLTGDEEYTASGQSIKKAQHAAAQLALQKTSFQLAESKPKMKNQSVPQTSKPTPTVELNALTMKLNLLTLYNPLPPSPIANQACSGSSGGSSGEASGRAENPQSAQEGHFVNTDYQTRVSGISSRFQQYPNQVILLIHSFLHENY